MESDSKYKKLEALILSNQKTVNDLYEKVVTLSNENNKLNEEVIGLIDTNIDLATKLDETQIKINEISSKLKTSEAEVSKLKKENDSLRKKIYRKNSRNSSIPPSQDPNRIKKNQSLREKSGKKQGGQTGHKGSTLDFYSKSTQVINHYPNECECCGNRSFLSFDKYRRRQIIDLPKTPPEVIEHWTYQGACTCGHHTQGTFPKNVKAPISYGPKTLALISYLSVRQFIPIKRIEEMFRQVYGMKICAATINNKLAQSSDKLLKLYSWIYNEIMKSDVVGSDETGCNINGDNKWMWTWQTNSLTYLRLSNSRGAQTINDVFPQGLPNAIMVHDCLSAQFLIKAKGHQICIAHLLRELNYFIEIGSKWSIKFKQKLKEALNLLEKIKQYPKKNYNLCIKKINNEIDKLLADKQKKKGKIPAFIKRIIKRRKSLLRFLDDPSIPPDNNASERAFRNVKVKLKVSGMFKTESGADQFAIIRSVIDTFIKRDQPVMNSLIKALS